jgi:acetyl/propionyl-CoA carboxylase alpha subunit
MRRALFEYVVTGISNNLAFHERLLAHPEFAAGRYDTGFIERHKDALLGPSLVNPEQRTVVAAAVAVAAARMEKTKPRLAPQTQTGGGCRPSPWVAQHRARARSR